MFLQKIMDRNPALLETVWQLHHKKIILPDTYVLDLDTILQNATHMLEEAKKHHISLFFMTKQIGRIPYIAQELVKLGYEGAVCVDYKEAIGLYKQGVPISHVGHLVQTPSALVEPFVEMKPSYMTVYSLEKAAEINEACRKQNLVQEILLRVIGDHDFLYPSQYGGFALDELPDYLPKFKELSHIRIAGVTSFPCFLYNEKTDRVDSTPNISTLQKAKLILEAYGIQVREVNMPSATCTETIPLIANAGGTQGEPGHGLTGTTPMHAFHNWIERPAIVYVSEISHVLGDQSYCYGGGHYRRSGMRNALVGSRLEEARKVTAYMPDSASIDYYFELDGRHAVGDPVVMAYRTQMFVTRSDIAVVKGISEGNPKVLGIYDTQGRLIREV